MPESTTSSVQHTHIPGPWTMRPSTSSGGFDIVGYVPLNGDPDQVPMGVQHIAYVRYQYEADARLITASPDGLEVARFALSVLQANPVELSERMAIEKLEAFIAKATTP